MMTDKKILEDVYVRMLDEEIIKYIAENKKIDNRLAMEIYYKSTLCGQIHEGKYGIQYLDYKNLALDLMENESHLF